MGKATSRVYSRVNSGVVPSKLPMIASFFINCINYQKMKLITLNALYNIVIFT